MNKGTFTEALKIYNEIEELDTLLTVLIDLKEDDHPNKELAAILSDGRIISHMNISDELITYLIKVVKDRIECKKEDFAAV